MTGAALTQKESRERRNRLPEVSFAKLPRWRGFNLLEKFHYDWSNTSFVKTDLEWIAELGFNFVRLPMDYRCWTERTDWTKMKEPVLQEIDKAIQWCNEFGIHVCLNFHRAPGYTVASPPEPVSLWTDETAQKVCAWHWRQFAKRYKGISNRNLSFNLLNEPAGVSAEVHRQVVERIVSEIRTEDENRLTICDGREWGNTPPEELIGLKVAAATRGYLPFTLTHYRAEWASGSDRWSEPTWPHKEGSTLWDQDRIRSVAIEPWKRLERKGIGVMVGEFGCYNRTPHEVVLRWMESCLRLWKEAGWGWALWNFRGSFGILDSGRSDVVYENWRGHKLDRKMLDLLQGY